MKILCNSCKKEQDTSNFNSSDLKQYRYTCKECKAAYRANVKAKRIEKLAVKTSNIVCNYCKEEKPTNDFNQWDLANCNYICKSCKKSKPPEILAKTNKPE